jgi:hypothetical protein
LGDQFPVPGDQSLGRNKRGHLFQDLPTQAFGFGGQSAALVVIKPQAPLAELLAQDPFSSRRYPMICS